MRVVPLLALCWATCLAPARLRAEVTQQELGRNAQAVSHGKQGLEALAAGDLERAYRAFSEAERLAHSPVFQLYLARVRAKQGELEEALVFYEQVRAEAIRDDAPDAWRAAVARAIEEGEAVRVEVEARRAAAATAADASLDLEVTASPKAGPVSEKKGAHSPSGHAGLRRATTVAAVTAAAGALVGAGAGLVALLTFQSVKSRCTSSGCNPSDAGRVKDVQAWGRVADVGFVVAGAGLSTAAVLFWITPSPSSLSTSPRASFGIGANGRF